MSISNHFNHDYEIVGTDTLPQNVGDRFYSQDLSRDFNYLQDRIGQIIEDQKIDLPLIISGLEVSKGTGNTLNITSGIGYASYDVTTTTTSWAVPPVTQTETIDAVRIVAEAQTDLTTSATLDDVTVNYVKLSYAEIETATRIKAKLGDTYTFIKAPSYEYTIDAVTPDDYDIVLATFVSVGNNIPETFDISLRSNRYYPGNIYETFTAQETITRGDPIGVYANEAWVALADDITSPSEYTLDTTTNPVYFGADYLGDNFIIYALTDSIDSNKTKLKIHELVGDVFIGRITLAESSGLTASVGSNVATLDRENKIFIVHENNGGNIQVRVGRYDGTLTVDWLTSVTDATDTIGTVVDTNQDIQILNYEAGIFAVTAVEQVVGDTRGVVRIGQFQFGDTAITWKTGWEIYRTVAQGGVNSKGGRIINWDPKEDTTSYDFAILFMNDGDTEINITLLTYVLDGSLNVLANTLIESGFVGGTNILYEETVLDPINRVYAYVRWNSGDSTIRVSVNKIVGFSSSNILDPTDDTAIIALLIGASLPTQIALSHISGSVLGAYFSYPVGSVGVTAYSEFYIDNGTLTVITGDQTESADGYGAKIVKLDTDEGENGKYVYLRTEGFDLASRGVYGIARKNFDFYGIADGNASATESIRVVVKGIIDEFDSIPYMSKGTSYYWNRVTGSFSNIRTSSAEEKVLRSISLTEVKITD